MSLAGSLVKCVDWVFYVSENTQYFCSFVVNSMQHRVTCWKIIDSQTQYLAILQHIVIIGVASKSIPNLVLLNCYLISPCVAWCMINFGPLLKLDSFANPNLITALLNLTRSIVAWYVAADVQKIFQKNYW